MVHLLTLTGWKDKVTLQHFNFLIALFRNYDLPLEMVEEQDHHLKGWLNFNCTNPMIYYIPSQWYYSGVYRHTWPSAFKYLSYIIFPSGPSKIMSF